MKRFVEGVERSQGTLFPDRLEDWIGDDNPVRAIDVFVDELASANSPSRRHSATNRAQTLRIAGPLSLRKSAIVL